MDLEHRGAVQAAHCEADRCGQRDFLPFTCDLCLKKFCLAHKGYMAHSCGGGGRDHKDKYSVECPMCLKSVQFVKSENVDAAWERHYFTECTHTQPAVADRGGAARCPACTKVLGASNTYTCPTCALVVCLSCRSPEAHKCAGVRAGGGGGVRTAAKDQRQAFLDRMQQQQKQQQQQQQQQQQKGKVPKAVHAAGTTSGRGNASAGGSKRSFDDASAAGGGKVHDLTGSSSSSSSSSSSGAVESHRCPQCNERFSSAVTLVGHFETAHPDSPSRTSNSNSKTSRTTSSSGGSGLNASPLPPPPAGGVGQEVCPHCSQRFADVMDLISHVETMHAT